MSKSFFQSLYQVNTRVWMTELSLKLGRHATLDDIPDTELDSLSDKGFDWIWFLSVWQTGADGQRISRQNEGWRREFEDTLPDLKEEDIAGSGFAITAYTVSKDLGGDEALSRLRTRLMNRGMKLMLDFVPNHTAPDHHWVHEHIDYYIRASEKDLEREPQNYRRINSDQGDVVLALGRDPFFSGWPDTLQLNYGNTALQEAMAGELTRIAGQCDGVRCDMAMLVLPDVFLRTWGIRCQPFWPRAARQVREVNPEFCFMAEVYWDLEWTMLQQGFEYAYDKRLYDRLKEGHARPVREHFSAGLDYQSRMARFLENHDEPRVAADFAAGMHEAAAVITFLSPGLRFFHQGQFEGRKKRISPHLVRGPEEPVNNSIVEFYDKLLGILRMAAVRSGRWQLMECHQAWESNWTHNNFISFAWQGEEGQKILVAVNYSPSRSQCYIKHPFSDLEGKPWTLKDLLGGNTYEREGTDLQQRGMYLDEPGWKAYVFMLEPKQEGSNLEQVPEYTL
ncbi:MAG: alpha-amylase family glycosyl hydrolase [Bacteroidales bacterium]|nr:alpha-amylase family glycosyl hydrolase [Bacteroidales bacterium]